MPDNPRQEIISLDFLSNAYALEVATRAKDRVWGFRINEFIYHYGSSAIYELKNYGKVFADIKLHDNLTNTKAILRTMQAAGADLVSIYPCPGLVLKDFDMSIAVMGDAHHKFTFAKPDILQTPEGTLEIIHAHLLDPMELSAKLMVGALDGQPVGEEEM